MRLPRCIVRGSQRACERPPPVVAARAWEGGAFAGAHCYCAAAVVGVRAASPHSCKRRAAGVCVCGFMCMSAQHFQSCVYAPVTECACCLEIRAPPIGVVVDYLEALCARETTGAGAAAEALCASAAHCVWGASPRLRSCAPSRCAARCGGVCRDGRTCRGAHRPRCGRTRCGGVKRDRSRMHCAHGECVPSSGNAVTGIS